MKHGFKSVALLAVAAGVLGSCANMVANDAVDARKATMRGMSGDLKAIGDFVKGGPGSAADVAARARKIASTAETIPGMFPAGSGMEELGTKTRATAAIWAKPAAFEQAASIMGVYANRLALAADTGNKNAIGEAMGQLGKQGCGGCHGDFRGPKPQS